MSDKIREALAGLLAIVDESEGVAGYHLNGEIAEWYTFAEVDAAREALAEAPPAQQSQWVKVSERLPSEDQGTVAVLFDDGHPGVAWATYWHGARTDFAQWTFPLDDLADGREVTHWMPLPAAPGDTAAPEQAEQPSGTTSDKYRAELYDEVWQKARDMGYGNVTEALVKLERIKGQAEQDAVTVPRELLERLARSHSHDDHWNAIDELRALLGGGE